MAPGHFFGTTAYVFAAILLVVGGVLLQQTVQLPRVFSSADSWQAPKYGRVVANDGRLITIELPDKTSFVFEAGPHTSVVQTIQVQKGIEDVHVGSEVLLGPATGEDRSARRIELFTAP